MVVKMKRKLRIGGIIVALMLVTIAFSTVVNSTSDDQKESPLYKLRTRRAINEKIDDIIEDIKTKFIGERIFFIPFQWIRARYDRYTGMQQGKGDEDWTDTPGYDSCYQTCIGIPGCIFFTKQGPEYCYDTESHPKCYTMDC